MIASNSSLGSGSRGSRDVGRARRASLNLALLAASVLFALASAELLVRWLAPQQLIVSRPDMWQPDDTLGWTQRAGVNTTINTGERTVHFLTDSLGMRVGARGRTPSDTRVLVIGDSFMEALQVEYEASVAGLLETRLSTDLGKPVAVYNAGVGGYDTDQYVLQLRRSLRRQSYSVVLVSLFLGNDVIASRRTRVPARVPTEVHRLRLPRRLSWREVVDATLYPVNDFLEVRSQLFTLAKHRFQFVLIRLGLSAAEFTKSVLRKNETAPMWENTLQLCYELAAVTTANGTPVVFVLIPDALQVWLDRLTGELAKFRVDSREVDVDQPNRLLLAPMRARGLAVVDATDALRESERNGMNPYGDVDPHLSPVGHRVTADVLEPAVLAVLKSRHKRTDRMHPSAKR